MIYARALLPRRHHVYSVRNRDVLPSIIAMTFQQELNSWKTPSVVSTSPVPEVGVKAPSTSKLELPNPNGKPTVITFLRHCGCPCKPELHKSDILLIDHLQLQRKPSKSYATSQTRTRTWILLQYHTPTNQARRNGS